MNLENIVALIITAGALLLVVLDVFNLSKWRGVCVALLALSSTWALCVLSGLLLTH